MDGMGSEVNNKMRVWKRLQFIMKYSKFLLLFGAKNQ